MKPRLREVDTRCGEMRYGASRLQRHDIINVEDHIHPREMPDAEKQFHAAISRIDSL